MSIIYPEAVYLYKRHTDPEGKQGTRWDYVTHEGKEYPCLTRTLKRSGARVIYYGLNTRTHKQGLWRGKDKADTGWISEVYQPDIKRPGLGFGDLGDRADAGILIRADEETCLLTILVFPGLRNQAETLFKQCGMGAVRESVFSNNVILPTETVQTASKTDRELTLPE